jgi:hypothetical protein
MNIRKPIKKGYKRSPRPSVGVEKRTISSQVNNKNLQDYLEAQNLTLTSTDSSPMSDVGSLKTPRCGYMYMYICIHNHI